MVHWKTRPAASFPVTTTVMPKNMMKAQKSSWKNFDMPKEREKIPFEALYSDLEAEKMMEGFIPEGMDDKWFTILMQGGCFSIVAGQDTAYLWSNLMDAL